MIHRVNNEMIGTLLVEKGGIESRFVEEALREQTKSGGLLGEILTRMGGAREEQVLEALAEQFGLEVKDPAALDVPREALEKVSSRLARHYAAIPVSLENNTLCVAMPAPPGADQLQELCAILGVEVNVSLATTASLEKAMEKYYGVGSSVVEKMVKDRDGGGTAAHQEWTVETIEEADGAEGESSVRELVNQVLTDAWKRRATDIHLEPFPGELVARYRIDGVLCDARLPREAARFYRGMVSRLKIMSNLDISEQRRPQDGRLKLRFHNQDIDMRISLLPTAAGESVVIRILSPATLLKMKSVGLNESHLEKLKKVIEKPHGMVLLTGPTGSGKTTTLYSCLNELNEMERKIITVEDPVEYLLRGIIQMQIHTKIGLSFAAGLRHMLRHDPDVMMVGEIRDGETAEIAIRSALTGHLVFSTLHTNDAPSAVARLLDLGVAPYLVSSSLTAVIAQRLVRVICESCKKESPLGKYSGEEFSELLRTKFAGRTFYHGTGCDDCRGTGYKGRTAIHELMLIDEELSEMISERASMSEIRKKAHAVGMEDLRIDGLEKAAAGITTVHEVFRVTR